uniref:Nup54 domain-containing protein n=1 Tax=Angiostrongylus costaricensis TaxID=334426 RepID=A0A158PM77_ANGCS
MKRDEMDYRGQSEILFFYEKPAGEVKKIVEELGPCVNNLCPETYQCNDNICIRPMTRARADLDPIGPCVNDTCPDRHVVFVLQMSLFGSKPLFGSTGTTGTSSGFTFGSTAATTSAPSLFGTTTTTSAPSLFGTTTTTSAPSLFGSTTTTSAPSLFGSATTTTSTSKPLFGSVPQSGTATSLFGTTTTTSSSLFGTKTVTTTAGGAITTGFGSTGGTGLFGSKPMTGGLFGSTLAAQPAVETKQTFQGILQDSDALVRSLTKVELFGDERDEMIAKLNQLAAAMGVGCGYYKDGQQPVQYSQLGPFHRIKTFENIFEKTSIEREISMKMICVDFQKWGFTVGIGYNRTSEYTESDGIVALVVKAPFSEYRTSEQKQKFVDVLFVILGSKPTVHAHIESVRALPDNCTEICIYVTEKFRGRITSRELSQYLNQAPQKQQLESQLKVDKERIVSRVQMDKRQKELYLKDPPTGFDASLWAQAVRENPDPERLVPYPIRGFEQLRSRQKVLIENVHAQNAVVDSMNSKIGRIESNVSAVAVHFARQKVIQKQLSHRLLRYIASVDLLNFDDS